MTERKIVLYLEQKTFFERKKLSVPFDGDHWKEWIKSPDSTRLVTYEIYNSLSNILDHLFYIKNWDRSVLINLRKKTMDKIAVISWEISQKHLCKDIESIDLGYDQSFFNLTINERIFKNKMSLMLHIKAQEYIDVQKSAPYLLRSLKNSFNPNIGCYISDNVFRSVKHRYRVYLDDRLLVERYYPVDIEYNRMLAETIYFNENAQGTLRIESDFDLQIKRVEVDGQRYDTYSTSFQLL